MVPLLFTTLSPPIYRVKNNGLRIWLLPSTGCCSRRLVACCSLLLTTVSVFIFSRLKVLLALMEAT